MVMQSIHRRRGYKDRRGRIGRIAAETFHWYPALRHGCCVGTAAATRDAGPNDMFLGERRLGSPIGSVGEIRGAVSWNWALRPRPGSLLKELFMRETRIVHLAEVASAGEVDGVRVIYRRLLRSFCDL